MSAHVSLVHALFVNACGRSFHSYASNMAEAPFLRLPAELRNRIYEDVLGNKTIHIGYYDCPEYVKGRVNVQTLYRRNSEGCDLYAKIWHSICQAEESESEVYARSKGCSTEYGCSWPSITAYDNRHERCLLIIRTLEEATYDTSDGLTVEQKRLRYLQKCENLRRSHQQSLLDLGLLRVFRQIHREAALIPYESNTFAFECGYVLDQFISGTLIAPQREAIKSIQAGNWLRGYDIDLGLKSIRPSTVLSLKNLTSIEVALEYEWGFPDNGIQFFFSLGLV